MKATEIILATFLTLHINLLFAGDDGAPKTAVSGMNSGTRITLAPAAPKEAVFEEL